MASVLKRARSDGTIGYQVTWRFAGHRDAARYSITADSLADAKAIRGLVETRGQAVTRTQVLTGLTSAPTSGDTVAAWVRRYVAALTGVEANTRAEYMRLVDQHIAPLPLGALPLERVSREDVRLWVLGMRHRKTGAVLSPKSISNHHSLLSAALAEAVNTGRLAANPCRGVRLPRADDHTTVEEVAFLSVEEVRLIADALGIWGDVAWLLARTGLRWAELTGLQVGDVELEPRPRLSVARSWRKQSEGGFAVGPPKTRRSRRTISLDGAVADILRPRLSRSASSWVVTTSDGRSPLMRSTFAPHWYRAVNGLVADGKLAARPRMHDLRHTHASWLIAAGVPLVAIQRRLGHESITTTMNVYGHLLPAVDEAIVAALDGL